MWRMLQPTPPTTRDRHRPGPRQLSRELVEAAFSHVGLNWQDYVVQDPRCCATGRSGSYGRSSKARKDWVGLQGGVPGAGSHDGRRRSRALELASSEVLARPSPRDRRGRVRRPTRCGTSGAGRSQGMGRLPRPGRGAGEELARTTAQKAVTVIPLEITDPTSVSAALGRPFEAIVHLAAVASGSEARSDQGLAPVVDAAQTLRLVDAAVVLQGKTGVDPLLLVVSSAEVYGNGRRCLGGERPSRAPVAVRGEQGDEVRR